MTPYRLRTDLERFRLGTYALPLGIEPVACEAPTEGYTVAYSRVDEDGPDVFGFHIVVSHERLAALTRAVFDLLPERVLPIVELDSLDAYRTVDVYLGRAEEPVRKRDFLRVWEQYEPFLLEDGNLGAGANSFEPFVEVFLDTWKGLTVHVPPDWRESVEGLLAEHGVEPVSRTWRDVEDSTTFDAIIRPVLDISEPRFADFDTIMLDLQAAWRMELDIDPGRNLDEAGRELGMTLWYAEVLVHAGEADDGEGDATVSVWASARSLDELEELIAEAMRQHPGWEIGACGAMTRVAFDDRPPELDDLPLKRDRSEVHALSFHDETAVPSGGDPDEEGDGDE